MTAFRITQLSMAALAVALSLQVHATVAFQGSFPARTALFGVASPFPVQQQQQQQETSFSSTALFAKKSKAANAKLAALEALEALEETVDVAAAQVDIVLDEPLSKKEEMELKKKQKKARRKRKNKSRKGWHTQNCRVYMMYVCM